MRNEQLEDDEEKSNKEKEYNLRTSINEWIEKIGTDYRSFFKAKPGEYKNELMETLEKICNFWAMYTHSDNKDLQAQMISNNMLVVMTYLNSGHTNLKKAVSKVKEDYEYQDNKLDIELRIKLMYKFSLYIKRILDQTITLPRDRQCFSYGVLRNLNYYLLDQTFHNEYASISNFLIAINVLYIYGVLDNNKDDNLEPTGIIKSLKDFIIRIDKILGIVIPRV